MSTCSRNLNYKKETIETVCRHLVCGICCSDVYCGVLACAVLWCCYVCSCVVACAVVCCSGMCCAVLWHDDVCSVVVACAVLWRRVVCCGELTCDGEWCGGDFVVSVYFIVQLASIMLILCNCTFQKKWTLPLAPCCGLWNGKTGRVSGFCIQYIFQQYTGQGGFCLV